MKLIKKPLLKRKKRDATSKTANYNGGVVIQENAAADEDEQHEATMIQGLQPKLDLSVTHDRDVMSAARQDSKFSDTFGFSHGVDRKVAVNHHH